MASELNHHVGYSQANECWFVRFYPYQTEQQASEAAAAFTRPAPAATDTGLVTWKFHSPVNGSAKMIQSDNGEWVPRSQAAELLAAKDKTIALAETTMIEMHQDLNKIEAELAALTARIKAMEEERASLVEKMGMQISAQLARAEKAEAKLAAAEKAAKSVEQWWLSEGMKHFDGAPYCIFATRAVLGGQKRPWEFKDDEHDL